jgi:hypothetical protein
MKEPLRMKQQAIWICAWHPPVWIKAPTCLLIGQSGRALKTPCENLNLPSPPLCDDVFCGIITMSRCLFQSSGNGLMHV